MADLYNVNTTSIANSSTSIQDLEIPLPLWFLLTLYLGLVVLMGLLGNLVPTDSLPRPRRVDGSPRESGFY